MSEDQQIEHFQRKVTPVERLFTHSPFSIVAMVARIKGQVTEGALRNAVTKVQQRHRYLNVRIQEDGAHTPWFTTEGVGEIPIEIVSRQSDHGWIEAYAETARVPFEFAVRPAIRFILLQSLDISDVMIVCHHIICDGMSLAFLARDLMSYLGDPDHEAEVLPDPPPVDLDTIPADVSLNGIVKFFIKRLNKQWETEQIYFDQEDYVTLTQAYWKHFTHNMQSVELSEAQTSTLVGRCRAEGVTVNSAISAAFAGAQSRVLGEHYDPRFGIAANVRDRLRQPTGEGMGFYAGLVTPKYIYDHSAGFWDNARRFHQKVKLLFTDKNLFKDFVLWCHLEPAILEAINFKKLGGLVSPDTTSHQKLSTFAGQNDVVLSILKRDKMESLDRTIMGTAVTNLGRLDFPRQYGELNLDRLIMQPGGAFPLVNVNLVVGAVTCAGKLSLLLGYAEEAVDTPTMEKIKDIALASLLDE